MQDLKNYKRVWIWKWRHSPIQQATNEHRKAFRVMFTHSKKGRCANCGIIQKEAPNHNCLDINLDPEMAIEFVSRLLSTNWLGE